MTFETFVLYALVMFYGHHHDRYGIKRSPSWSLRKKRSPPWPLREKRFPPWPLRNIYVTNDHGYVLRKHYPVLSSFMTYDWVCNWSNTTGETWVHSRFLVGFDRVARSLEFCLLLCRSLLVFSFLSLFIWPLCCLPFDLQILISPLVSSNSSYV